MQVQRFDFKEFTSSSIEDLDNQSRAFRKTSLIKRKEALQPPLPPVEPPPPPPEPTFSEAELKAAELKGYQRGFAEGMEDGKRQLDQQQAEIQAQLLQHTEGFVKTITPLFSEYRKMSVELKKQMPQVALAIAKKVAGPALEANAQTVVQDMVLTACESMISEPKLIITVHESMGDMLAKQLETLTSRLQATNDIVILRSPDMPLSDCKVEWNNGAMERNTDRIWQQAEKVTENLAASIARDTNEQLDGLEENLPKAEEPAPKETNATPEALIQAPVQAASKEAEPKEVAPQTPHTPPATAQGVTPTTTLPSDTTSPAEKKE
jgi:flagellar assembly protein FliH